MAVTSTEPLIVLVAGGTASGKTTIARQFAAQTDAVLITHDRYYPTVADPRSFDYDHPDVLDTGLLAAHLRALRGGRPAPLPVYHFPTHTRLEDTEVVHPRAVIVVEGIFVLHDARLRELAHLAAYVDAPDDVRLIRRIQRDCVERGRDLAEVLHRYQAMVRPGHVRFVAPSCTFAHLVLDGLAPVEDSVAQLSQAVETMRRGRRR